MHLSTIFRKMLGGGGNNGNTIFPGFVEENHVQYNNNTLPQLQLFANGEFTCDRNMVLFTEFVCFLFCVVP